MDTLTAFELQLRAALRDIPPLTRPEYESGLGTARALMSLLDQLSALTGGVVSDDQRRLIFALGLRQVDVHGRPVNEKINRPDISYVGLVDGVPRRVNVEIETRNARRHETMVNNDPNAHNLFLLIHPWNGEIRSGYERLPGGTMTWLGTTGARAAIAALPRPTTDRTLAVTKSGGQVRRPPGATPPVPRAKRAKAVTRRSREAEWVLESEWEEELEELFQQFRG